MTSSRDNCVDCLVTKCIIAFVCMADVTTTESDEMIIGLMNRAKLLDDTLWCLWQMGQDTVELGAGPRPASSRARPPACHRRSVTAAWCPVRQARRESGKWLLGMYSLVQAPPRQALHPTLYVACGHSVSTTGGDSHQAVAFWRHNSHAATRVCIPAWPWSSVWTGRGRCWPLDGIRLRVFEQPPPTRVQLVRAETISQPFAARAR